MINRKKIIAGNWKMNKTLSQAEDLVKLLLPICNSDDVDVVFCPPYVNLQKVGELLKGSNIALGSQNMYFEESGAYTGEISPSMLKELNVKYVILGHSERREYFFETDEVINKKVKKALEHDLIPIICCGETLEQREEGITISFICNQIKNALDGISAEDVAKLIIAYEPIWAIGTGKVATSDQAEEVCKEIRNTIKSMYDENTSNQIRIQYGGSVNGSNASELFGKENIDGALVGGASLKEDFSNIIKGAL